MNTILICQTFPFQTAIPDGNVRVALALVIQTIDQSLWLFSNAYE